MGCCKSVLNFEQEVKKQDEIIENDLSQARPFCKRRGGRNKTVIRILTRQTIKCIVGHVSDYYEIKELIGEGAYGCVRKVMHKGTGVDRAMKTIMKSFVRLSEVKNMLMEVDILRKLDHPNIIKITEVVQDNRCYHIITELCTGGELFNKIVELERFTEKQAARFMYQLVSAVNYCHTHNVLHRDLKPENLLLVDDLKKSTLKIIDFGVARLTSYPSSPVKKYGKPYYTAPEVFNGIFTDKSDMWSCGVILYVMICGYLPFLGNKESQTITQVIHKEPEFTDKEWEIVSPEVIDLIKSLLSKTPQKRPSACEVLLHPWIQQNMFGISRKVCLDSVKNLIRFRSRIKIQQATFEYIVSHLSTQQELKELQDAFMMLDKNGDGKLSREEIIEGFKYARIREYFDIEEIIEECDADGSDFIEYSEFLTAAMNWQKALSKKKLETAFKTFDLNGDEVIDMNELKEIVGGAVDTEMYKEIMKEADTNGDGVIDFNEFEEICMKTVHLY